MYRHRSGNTVTEDGRGFAPHNCPLASLIWMSKLIWQENGLSAMLGGCGSHQFIGRAKDG